jgi:hypothetical protein
VTKTIDTFAGIAVPLPKLTLCLECENEIQVRADGTVYKHERAYDPDAPIYCDDDGYIITRCPGSRARAGDLLEPTFARWLWMQSKRRDDYTNKLTQFAAFEFRGCTRSPKLTARDVDWVTAEELHGRLHLIQLARTGSSAKNPLTGEEHDWMCDLLQGAADVHQELLAAQYT